MALAGILEIQLMAEMSRLSTDMKRAERVVADSTGKMSKSVDGLGNAFNRLNVVFNVAQIGIAFDTVRRLSDNYTKLTAQLSIATNNQAAYMRGMEDVRRISTAAQADISATTMLYTRLTNALDQHGMTQKQISNITESVSLGLKAYGASASEASSAMLQLSQAFGSGKLGGEEFRAVSEAMPNMMKILANSMGVPKGALRDLSMQGKITIEEMAKAWSNPALIDGLRKQADMTRTITGSIVVFGNELTLLVGALAKTSGITSSVTTVINAGTAAIKLIADNMNMLTNIVMAYASAVGVKMIASLIQARAAQAALTAAHVEAIGMHLAMAQSEASRLALNIEVIASERAKAISQLQSANATMASTATLRANAIATAKSAAATANLAALGRAQAVSTSQQTAATIALTAAEKLQAASSMSIMGSIGKMVGSSGWIGLALFGVWTVVDFLSGMKRISDGADDLNKKLKDLSIEDLQLARQKEIAKLSELSHGTFSKFNEREIRASKDIIRAYDSRIIMLSDRAKAAAEENKLNTAGELFNKEQAEWKHFKMTKEERRKSDIAELKERYSRLIAAKVLSNSDLLKLEKEYKIKLGEINKDIIADEKAKREKDLADSKAEKDRKLKEESDAKLEAVKKLADEENRIMEQASNNVADVMYKALTGTFVDIGQMFRDMLTRMAVDAAAQKLVMNTSSLLFGTAASVGADDLEIAAKEGLISTGGMAAAAKAAVPIAAAYVVGKYGFGIGNSYQYSENAMRGTVSGSGVNIRNERDWSIDRGFLFGGTSKGTDVSEATTAQINKVRYDTDQLHKIFVSYGSIIGDTSIATKAYNADVGDLANSLGKQLLPQLELFRMEGETLVQTAQRLTQAFNNSIDTINKERDAKIAAANANIAAANANMDAANAKVAQTVLDAQRPLLAAIKDLRNAALSIRIFAASLGFGTVERNKAEFFRVAGLAGKGDVTAQGQLQGAATSYLDLAKQSSASAIEYARIVGDVRNTLNATADQLDASATIAEKQLSALDKIVMASDNLKLIEQWTKATVDNSFSTSNNVTAVANAISALQLSISALKLSISDLQLHQKTVTTSEGDIKAAITTADLEKKALIESERIKVENGNAYVLEQKAKAMILKKKEIDERDEREYRSRYKNNLVTKRSFAVGTNELPFDMVAQVHAGERIIPAADNRELMSRLRDPNSANDALVNEIRSLRSEVAALRRDNSILLKEGNTNTLRTNRVMEDWDSNGMPDLRTA